MKLNLSLLILLALLGSEAAAQGSEFATGRAYYMDGEFGSLGGSLASEERKQY